MINDHLKIVIIMSKQKFNFNYLEKSKILIMKHVTCLGIY